MVLSLKDTPRAITNKIVSKAIKFLSGISNGRICMYLDSKEAVTSLTFKYKTVVVNNTNIEIRPATGLTYYIVKHRNYNPQFSNRNYVHKE